MGVVARMCDRIQVMRLGEYVEAGTAEEIFHAARHPYTKMLIDAMPRLDAKTETPGAVGEEVLSVDDVKVQFPIRVASGLFGKTVPLRAVDGVSFSLRSGKRLGLLENQAAENQRWPAPCCNSFRRILVP